MSTASRSTTTSSPLVAGQNLDQVTFHERYEAMPPGTRAELIDGVVYMPSPVGIEHGVASIPPIVWLHYYGESTPGVQILDNASVVLNPTNEVQPDVWLRVLPEYGGRTRNDRGIVYGVPELVVEVSRSTKKHDLGLKLVEYERAGVLEYLVRMLDPDEIRWHRLQNGKLVLTPPDPDFLYRSVAFPGLWLDPVALVADDGRRLRAVVDQGTRSPEHAAFVTRLAGRKS